MNRDIRVLQNNKADVTKIVTQKPSNSEGVDGDIAVGNTANGSSLFAKIKNVWYEFSSNESFGDSAPRVQGSVSFIFGGYTDTGTSNFIPIGRHFDEVGTTDGSGTANQAVALLLPYDCRIISITLRSTAVLGDSNVKIYSAPDGANINSSATTHLIETSATVSCSVAHTTYRFDFSGHYTLPANNIAQFQLTTTNNQVNVNYILTLDYDIPT